MLFFTIIGCFILLVIQFVLYKKDNQHNILLFFKSNMFLKVCKDLLIIFLGAIIALNLTSYTERKETLNHVIKLLETARNDVNTQYAFNTEYLHRYNQKEMDINTARANVNKHYDIIKNILENDTIITTISPLGYSMLISEVRNLDSFYDCFQNKELDEEASIIGLTAMNSTCEGITVILDIEINRLKKDYTDRETENSYNDYLNERFVKID